jgi:cytochrome c
MSSIVVESNIETDGKLIISNKEEIKYDNISTLNFDGILTLNNNAKTKFNTTFIATPTIENKNIAGGVSEEESETKSGDLPEGLKLIAKSDCKTCHNKNLQTIGPAYTAIAKKYKNTPENIAMLAKKVKNGGSGIWGEQAMTPHPDLADEVINEMVSYIMSLDNDDEEVKAETSETNTLTLVAATDVKEEEMLPGSLVRIYDIVANSKIYQQ